MASEKSAVALQGHPLISRVSTDELHALHDAWLASPEDLTVQQRVDTHVWHRRAIGGFFTACGKSINGPDSAFADGSMRHESYLEELCTDGCFSEFELKLSDQLNKAEQARKDADLAHGSNGTSRWIPFTSKK